MGSNPTQSGNTPPPKPWERAGTSSGPAPFKPPSSGSTSDIVEASGTAKPGEVVASAQGTVANRNTLARPVPPRPWEQNYGNTYGGYGSSMNYNSGYGSGVNYNSVGGFGGGFGGGSLGGGMYGTMNNRGYGGGLYGGSGMYGGSMYNNSGFGGQMGGYGMGMGMGGGNYGDQDPNNPYGPPSSPPGFWMSFIRMMNGVVNIFGRISILVDQNTQAFHMFMTALLQLFDRSGVLYGELARFVLRILGIRSKPKMHQRELLGSNGQDPLQQQQQHLIQGPKAPIGAWDSVWENEGPK